MGKLGVVFTDEQVGMLLYVLNESIRQDKAEIKEFLLMIEDEKTSIDLRKDAKRAVDSLEKNILEVEEIIRKIHEGERVG